MSVYICSDKSTKGIVSRDRLPRGVLPSDILKIEIYCSGLKVRSPTVSTRGKRRFRHTMHRDAPMAKFTKNDGMVSLQHCQERSF